MVALQLIAPDQCARAAGTVGTGSGASCTEAALDTALAGGGMVTFNCGAAPAMITLTAQKAISQDTAIDGGGTITLSGGGSTRLFQVNTSVILKLDNLTLTGGSATPGGAIDTAGSVFITNCSLSNNSAPGGIAGALHNTGTVTITGSTVSDNSAPAGLSGAIDNGGQMTISSTTLSGNFGGFAAGAIGNSGTLTIRGCTFQMNQADHAGAIQTGGPAASLTISASTFSSNTAINGFGGAVYNDGLLTLTGSTFVGNSAASGGGGIYTTAPSSTDISGSTLSGNSASTGGGVLNTGLMSITASTLSANAAVLGMGGGIFNDTTGTLTVTNSTVSGNTGVAIRSAGTATVQSSTIYGNMPEGVANPGLHQVALQNTIVAGNGPPNCLGTITSLGNNLESADTCGLGAAGDLRSTDPLLGALANNGGPTMTHALPPQSPAVDAGSANCPPTDQRGMPRPVDGNGDGTAVCDIGAYEYTPPTVTTTTTTTLPCAVVPTFASIDCRLATLIGLVGNQVPAGAMHDTLAAALGKAGSLVAQAETAAGQGKGRGAKRKLSKAISALRKFEARLRSHRAKGLASALRDSLRTASGDLRQALAMLRASLSMHG